ncbi:hypothetical protein B0J11DRAFT_544978 [Dendryphion nanum]|uniref:Uncharacterized protein n=1 Tax=Dendryphion nanum TaxID=256645 RepID=A0A9P9I7N8_9PLEO|nr:hypothetical protein B0J11DRAFT_544978 [Dendryphion nanum]
MRFSTFLTFVPLLSTALAHSGKLTAEDALAVLEMRSVIDLEAREAGLEKRACRYSSCDECLTKHAPCRAFENNPDCLSCSLQCITWCGAQKCC